MSYEDIQEGISIIHTPRVGDKEFYDRAKEIKKIAVEAESAAWKERIRQNKERLEQNNIAMSVYMKDRDAELAAEKRAALQAEAKRQAAQAEELKPDEIMPYFK